MFARKHVHIAGGKAATQIATAAGKGVGLGLVAAFAYKLLDCDNQKARIEEFYKNYVPSKDSE